MKKIIRKIRHSLALRLMLLSLLTLFVVAVVFFSSIAIALRGQFQENLLPHVIQYQKYIQQDIGFPPDLEKAAQLAKRLSIDLFIEGEDTDWSSTGDPFNGDFVSFKTHSDSSILHARQQGHFYLRSNENGYTTTLVVRRSEKILPPVWKSLALLGLITVLTLSYFAIRRLFKPIEIIQSSVRKIGLGSLDHRISGLREDELGDLASSINGMAAEIEAMLSAKRTLLLAISHELRSPITRCRVSLELLEDSKNKKNIKRDLIEMETLIEDLLESERLNQQHTILDPTEVEIAVLIEGTLQSLFSEAEIQTDFAHHPSMILLDTVRIRLLIKNILNNAVRFNQTEKGKVRLSTSEYNGQLVIEVTDHGPGIEAEHIQHLTDAFYRIDPSRRRETGGYGLGLYLCKAIALAHGGTLEINSESGKGTVVRVALPYVQKSK